MLQTGTVAFAVATFENVTFKSTRFGWHQRQSDGVKVKLTTLAFVVQCINFVAAAIFFDAAYGVAFFFELGF
jgi:hypothetical protein